MFVCFLPLGRCFTAGTVTEMPEDGLKEGWQLKFMVDDRCVVFICYHGNAPISRNLRKLCAKFAEVLLTANI